MLSREQIDEQLKGPCPYDREPLETAQQLAEWLAWIASYWFLRDEPTDNPLGPMDDWEKVMVAVDSWLKGEGT